MTIIIWLGVAGEPTMIEILGFLYGLGKDLKKYIEWDVEDKVVDREWLNLSGFKVHMELEGYNLKWCLLEKVESRLLSGYEVAYEIDKSKRVRRRIVRGPEHHRSVLIGRKSDD